MGERDRGLGSAGRLEVEPHARHAGRIADDGLDGDGRAGRDRFPAVIAPSVSYYLEATDASAASNVSTLPAQGQAAPFVVAVGTGDQVGPVIVHQPVANGQPAAAGVAISATVTDVSGVAEVRVYFRAAGAGTFQSEALGSTDGTAFTGRIPGASVFAPAVDYYRGSR
ncbi:MAG TPA: hypothetical protein DFS52_21425 [Myxococcales bacterium]|nr:hypothetical protein [Myxococcales bacterium]